MTEIYISLEDAAKFEGIKYNTLVQKLKRGTENYRTIMRPSESGGKSRVMIELSSLSKKAKTSYAKSLQKNNNDKLKDDDEADEVPWYVSIDINKYIEDNKKQYYEAIEFAKVLTDFISYEGKNKTEYAKQVADENNISQRSLYLQSEKYLEAQAWALKINSMDGMNYDYFKIIALCRKPKVKGQLYALDPQIACLIENMLSNRKLAPNNITTAMIFEKAKEFSIDKQIHIPSASTVYRYVKSIKENNRGALYIAEKGTREYNRNVLLKGSRDTKSVAVMELVQGDGHTFDCFVKYTYPNGKVKAIKPKLLAWVDTRSRVIVGDVMCIEANAQVTKQSVLNVLYGYGTPEFLLIDNGKEYTAKELTGRKRKERFNIEVDDALLGFYKSIGIEYDIRCLPYQPWKKGQIERFFETVCNMFTKWFDSYVGTLTGSKTSAKVQKDIDKMLKKDELIDLDEFYELWAKWRDNVYHNRDHRGLKRMKEKFIKPIELFNNAEEKYIKAPPPKEYAVAQLMKADDAYVYGTGIRKFGLEYRSAELGDYIGKHVDIKYDMNDVTSIFAYDKKGNKICEAESWELLGMSPKVKYAAIEDHMRLQNRQKSLDKNKLKKLQTPYEEREEFKEIIEQHENHDGPVKGFVIANSKSKVKEIENVISLPVGKYENKKKDKVKTDYYKKQGEEIFKLIENM